MTMAFICIVSWLRFAMNCLHMLRNGIMMAIPNGSPEIERFGVLK